MIHSFDTKVAEAVGINAAIILHNIYFWVEKNRANETHFNDGYYWTYNSNKAFKELFPYLSEGQIRTAIDKLVTDGFLMKGNYNKNPYDRTCWYAITEQSHSFYRTNGCVTQNESKRDAEQMKNTYSKTHIKNTYTNTSAKAQPAKLFSTKKEEPKKVSKADKWLQGKYKIAMEYGFNEDVLDEISNFLDSLAEMNALISDITFRAQLDKFVNQLSNDEARLRAVKKTVIRGWKSLDYAINDELKGNHPSFDTSQPGSFQPKDPDNDLRYLDYEGQETY